LHRRVGWFIHSVSIAGTNTLRHELEGEPYNTLRHELEGEPYDPLLLRHHIYPYPYHHSYTILLHW
jgi:hypothetical protein